MAGLRLMFGSNAEPVTPAEWSVAGVTLASMVAFNVWGRGLVRMLCALEGLVAGYVAAWFTGLLGSGQFETLARVDWIALPSFQVRQLVVRPGAGGAICHRVPRGGHEGGRHDYRVPTNGRCGLGAA